MDKEMVLLPEGTPVRKIKAAPRPSHHKVRKTLIPVTVSRRKERCKKVAASASYLAAEIAGPEAGKRSNEKLQRKKGGNC